LGDLGGNLGSPLIVRYGEKGIILEIDGNYIPSLLSILIIIIIIFKSHEIRTDKKDKKM